MLRKLFERWNYKKFCSDESDKFKTNWTMNIKNDLYSKWFLSNSNNSSVAFEILALYFKCSLFYAWSHSAKKHPHRQEKRYVSFLKKTNRYFWILNLMILEWTEWCRYSVMIHPFLSIVDNFEWIAPSNLQVMPQKDNSFSFLLSE